MKGFFSWFKNSTKMKRWFLMILVGIVLLCYGIAGILVAKEMTFLELGKVAVLFVLGFTLTIIGIIFAQKRTLEVLVEASDLRLEKGNKNVNINSLIFNKKVYDKGPNIVVIGGGSGLNTVLKGLKNYTSNITAIVTVSDYGKLPSNSRKQLDLLPLEDIKESLIALSYNEPVMEQILNFKFQRDNLKDLSFGDIYLYAMKEVYGDFTQSIEASKDVLNITGRVLPVTLDEIKICAELENGMIVEEKEKIPDIVFDKVTKINRIYINPTNCVPAPGVLEAIKNADAIVIGPGSLYTNVIPNLLVKNVSRTIKESKAIKIYVNNIMTEPGQTDNFSIADHLQAIIDHAGNVIDYCIYDTGEIVPEYVRKYNRQGQDLVEQDIQKAKEKGIKLLQRNLSTIIDDNIRHSPKAVAEAIIQIICDDLKYRDMQNDPQYIMLNSRLKEEKKFKKHTRPIQKTKQEKTKTKSKAKHEKRTSKFAAKYQERIKSIQESDEQKIKNQMRMKKNNTEEYK
ncbi:MAG: YvcK family protein [Clostridia bacterium]|nr:YvcK family protein [Clostridia bacterium]